jgi:prolyl oligopeptidase
MCISCSVTDDEFRWLEQIDSPEATAWIDARNAEALALLGGEPFEHRRTQIREILDDGRRIPYPAVRGAYLYDFWTDAEHPRGLWRRTTWESYRDAEPDWDVLIDLDALGAAEGENWVWGGVADLPPRFDRFLVKMSRGGSDAVVVREYEVETREFVTGGYALPEAKSGVTWADSDSVFVMTDFGPGTTTTSGYARLVKLWRRGTDLSAAETVFEGLAEDVVVGVITDRMPGFERVFLYRWLDFIRRETWLRREDGALEMVPVPEDATWSTHGEWLVVQPRMEWLGHPAGTLLAIAFQSFMDGDLAFEVLFTPSPYSALQGWWWTRHHLILDVMTDVRNHLEVLTPGRTWHRASLAAPETGVTTAIVDTNPDENDDYLVASTGYLRPATLRHGCIPEGGEEVLKTAPSFFDADGMTVEQFFATSEDGTKVPYFVVGRIDGTPRPTLMTGYGGFRVSRLPDYDGVIGRTWLERGGVFVEASIRGGGEYGPTWHEAARRDGRPKAYEDFAAIAADLVERGITTRERLGAKGRSNGGLLMGVMLTRYPQLFGAIWAGVPLMDMQRYHRMLAGASWMGEYGDPDLPEDWAFLGAYSPYHHVRADAAYPPILITTSTRDDRVHPGHARKMAARLLAHGHDVTYYENREGGHAGAADHEQEAFVAALASEFLWRRLDT